MNRANLTRKIQVIALIFLAVGTILATGLITREQTVHALPEYAARTSEACGTCHVNPGGGGPRTLTGLLWAAQGRPDMLPELNVPIAPSVVDGAELYDIACAGCHGLAGEGLFGSAITGTGLKESKILSTILRGRERSGMPGFEGRLTEAQIDTLVAFAAGIASGEIDPQPANYPLPPAEFNCNPAADVAKCGGN